MNISSQKHWLLIHGALHNPSVVHVFVEHKHYPILKGQDGCRTISFENKLFIQQDPNKDSEHAQRARNGQKLTWVIRPGNWGLVVDDRIERE